MGQISNAEIFNGQKGKNMSKNIVHSSLHEKISYCKCRKQRVIHGEFQEVYDLPGHCKKAAGPRKVNPLDEKQMVQLVIQRSSKT